MRRILLFLALWLSMAPCARAHELAEASAMVVVRSGGHLELRLQVPWATLLQARLMPMAQPTDFLARSVSMPAPDFARQVALLTREIEAQLQLVQPTGVRRAFVRWLWPRAAAIQAALREELMSRLADGAAFVHASRLTTTAEVTLGTANPTVRLAVPSVLGATLVTVTHPREEWVRPGALTAPFATSATTMR